MAKAEKEKKPKVPSWISDVAKAIEVEGKALDMRAVSLSSTKGGIRWATSSGSLAIDVITGGGWAPGRAVSTFGPEQSGKTSGAYETLARCLLEGTVCIIYDAEQATDPDYLDRIIFKVTGHTMDFYLGIIEDDKVVKAGLLYYISPNTGENVFKHINRVVGTIPDVVKKKGEWYWVKQGSKKSSVTYEKRDIEGAISALVIIDSLPALVPEAQENNDDASPMAMLARMLSAKFPKTIGRCAHKRCTFLYTNQIREKIGQMFGNPEYEPGGNAPKFYSAQRLRFSAISLSTVDKQFITSGGDDEGKGKVDVERSWDGSGIDKYRYSKINVTKNKSFTPFQSTLVRWRIVKASQQGDGLDPSFDAYMYLYMTGQCSKKTGKGLSISLLGADDGEAISEKTIALLSPNPSKSDKKKKEKKKDKKKSKSTSLEMSLSWLDFKELVENPERKNALIKHCHKQLQSGYAYALYFATKSADNEEGE